VDNNTRNLFGNIQNTFADASAETGSGPVWPPDGEYDCYLEEVIVKSGEFRMKDGSLPAVTVQFVYSLCEDATRAVPLKWPGAAFDLPQNPSEIPNEGNMKRYEISLGRLKGHIQTLLGRPSDNLPADLELLQAGCGGDEAIIVKINCRSNERKGRTYHTEYVRELISGAFPVATA